MEQAGEPLTTPHDPGLLAAYAEGRLDAGERRAMTEHLGACADCRRALAMLARAGALPIAAPRRPVAIPVWLALAATVILATLAVRRPDGPLAGVVERGGETVASAPATPSEPPPAIVEAAPPARVPADDPMLDPALLVKRGPVRQAGGKTFRLRAGEWVDTALESTASLPTLLIQGADERAGVVNRLPGLRPYAALGERVVVVFDGSVYRFTP